MAIYRLLEPSWVAVIFVSFLLLAPISGQAETLALPFENSAGNAIELAIGDYIESGNINSAFLLSTQPRKNHQGMVGEGMAGRLGIEYIQRNVLDQETALLTYWLGEERSFVWVIGTNSVSYEELAGSDRIQAAAERVSRLLTSHLGRTNEERTRLALLALSNLVINPVADQILGYRRLVVVSDGALGEVPFAALPFSRDSESQALLERFEIVYSYSIAELLSAVSRRDTPSELDYKMAVLTAPEIDLSFDSSGTSDTSRFGPFSPLPHASQEARTIADFFPDEEVRFLGSATETDFLSAIEHPAQLLHLATHASTVPGRAKQKALLFSGSTGGTDSSTDGLVKLSEIRSLDVRSSLVVLSGCSTALNERSSEAEGMSLARAFLNAGAGATIGSRWNVDDQATYELMVRFYRHVASGNSPSAALRQAQLELRRDARWHAPFYWAGFVLEGEWHWPKSAASGS